MHSDRRRNGQNSSTPDKTFQTKDKTPGQKPPRTIEREFVQRTFVRVFVLGLLKMGGPRCVTYFWGSCDVRNRNRNRNLKTSKALLKSQAHQGTSLFTSAVRSVTEGGWVKIGQN